MVVIEIELLNSGKKRCILAKVVLFGKKLLHSGKSGCIRARWLYSGKVVIFGQKL